MVKEGERGGEGRGDGERGERGRGEEGRGYSKTKLREGMPISAIHELPELANCIAGCT